MLFRSLAPGASVELMTTSVGVGYQIVTVSSPVSTAQPSTIVCQIGNDQSTSLTQLPGTIVIGADTYNFVTIPSPYLGSYLNPQSCYNTTTGKYQPNVAGYYQVNAGITESNANWLYVSIVKNGTTPIATTLQTGAYGAKDRKSTRLNSSH